MTRWLFISLIINVIFLIAGTFIIRRMGGWRFFLYRWQHREAPLYEHRRQLFEQLPKQPGAIVFLGDSQTALCEWRELFGDTLPILNRGIVADHVYGIRNRLEEILQNQPTKIFLLVGINDLLFGKSIAEVEAGYLEILKGIKEKSPATQIVVQSVLPVNTTMKNMGIENAQIQAFNTRLIQIAEENNLTFVDIYNHLTDASGNLDRRFSEDGLHLNGTGYLVWKQQLARFLPH